ncbi:unnamed protein product, partial [Closterium sp. Naga37s-1]
LVVLFCAAPVAMTSAAFEVKATDMKKFFPANPPQPTFYSVPVTSLESQGTVIVRMPA